MHLGPIGPWAPLERSRRGREQQRFQLRLVQFLVKRPGQPCGLGTFEIGGHTTVEAHRPKAHRLYGEATPEHVLKLAQGHGPSTVALVKQLLARSGHVQQGLRSSVAVLRLSTRFESERLEAACQRALSIGAMSFKSVESILKTGLDRTPVPDPESSETSALPLEHANLRGADYYR